MAPSKAVDVEKLLQAKKAADAANSKPRFMSKKEREKAKAEREEREERERAAATAPKKPASNGVPNGVSARASNGTHNAVPTAPAAMRSSSSKQNGDMAPPPPPRSAASKGENKVNPEEATAALMRQRYLGPQTNQSTFSAKKKRKRTTEKKFNFDWGNDEDTSQDFNPVYQNRVEVGFFGRGHQGGLADDDEMKVRKYARAIEDADPETGGARAREILEMDRRRREEGGRMMLEKHWSEKRLDQMRERDWRILKEDFNISTKGGSIPHPMRNWAESNLPKRLLDIIDQVGYTDPSPVQRACIPIALQSRDLIGVAVTGSGKTAAFLLPLLVYIAELPSLNEFTKADGPYAIILAPTRELAQQIEIEAQKFATPLGFKCVSIVGGHNIEKQAYDLREGAEIIIATPGRLVDCIESRILVLGQCCYVIMDEADRMIDLGFEEPVNKILDALPVGNEKPDTDAAENAAAMSRHTLATSGRDLRYRQTMMYTATMPPAVERIARRYLRRPAIITIGNVGEAVETVEQRIEFIRDEDKRKKRLHDLLASPEFAPPIIVFVNTKYNCDSIDREVRRMGFSSVALHGGKSQDQREAALKSLRDGHTDVLVATDLAGRGIDVPDVSLVVNFYMAGSIEAYTHRIGRTGRAGKSGVAVTFLGDEDRDVMYDLRQMLAKSSISRVPDELRRHEAAQQRPQKLSKGKKPIE